MMNQVNQMNQPRGQLLHRVVVVQRRDKKDKTSHEYQPLIIIKDCSNACVHPFFVFSAFNSFLVTLDRFCCELYRVTLQVKGTIQHPQIKVKARNRLKMTLDAKNNRM